MIDRKEADEFRRESENYYGNLSVLAERLIEEGAESLAGQVLVHMQIGKGHVNLINLNMAALLPPEEETAEPTKRRAGKRAPKGQGQHRHKFNVNGICDLAIDGKMCAAKRQRAAKGQGEPKGQGERQQAIPTDVQSPNSRPTLGENAPDPYEGGTMGSSSATSARRGSR